LLGEQQTEILKFLPYSTNGRLKSKKKVVKPETEKKIQTKIKKIQTKIQKKFQDQKILKIKFF
jgi:hypothetical protein